MQTGHARADALKDLPTAADSGFADFEALAWWGVFAPKGTPSAVIERANAAFTDTLKQEAVSRQLRETQQINLLLDGPEQFRKFFAHQVDFWGGVVRDNNMSASSWALPSGGNHVRNHLQCPRPSGRPRVPP
jgi:tripartite-type tricarboxylate transporter receptor subunit TctC